MRERLSEPNTEVNRVGQHRVCDIAWIVRAAEGRGFAPGRRPTAYIAFSPWNSPAASQGAGPGRAQSAAPPPRSGPARGGVKRGHPKKVKRGNARGQNDRGEIAARRAPSRRAPVAPGDDRPAGGSDSPVPGSPRPHLEERARRPIERRKMATGADRRRRASNGTMIGQLHLLSLLVHNKSQP